MKETGIIMSGDHPKKILDGTKTMSRRVIKPQPFKGAWNATAEHPSYGWFWKKLYQTRDGEGDFFRRLVELCPYGQVGDRLWVRETFAYESPDGDRYVTVIPNKTKIFYHATDDWEGVRVPSIFMPRWASRIERIIVLLRAERLRDISEANAQAEGGYTIAEFISLFLKLNHLPEDANPWNWVIGW